MQCQPYDPAPVTSNLGKRSQNDWTETIVVVILDAKTFESIKSLKRFVFF